MTLNENESEGFEIEVDDALDDLAERINLLGQAILNIDKRILDIEYYLGIKLPSTSST